MPEKLTNIPTNLIMGFLGVGKTTAILDLLTQKPAKENWAVLVNEFGKVGIDGAIFSAAGATVKEISGGCLCCAVAVPFQVSINRLLKDARPDRLLIEPTGLGHPTQVLNMLTNDAFKEILDLRASICLIDPEKLKDERYTTNKNFIDQIALADVLVANKMDRADDKAVELFHHWAEKSIPSKAMLAQTTQGKLDINWLNISRDHQRQALFPEAHQTSKFYPVNGDQPKQNNHVDGYQSFSHIFPLESCFDFKKLDNTFKRLRIERIKGIIHTNQGWFIMNGTADDIEFTPTSSAINSRIEIIATLNNLQDFSMELNLCKINKN